MTQMIESPSCPIVRDGAGQVGYFTDDTNLAFAAIIHNTRSEKRFSASERISKHKMLEPGIKRGGRWQISGDGSMSPPIAEVLDW